MPKNSFKSFVEQELGTFPQFLINAILEWTLIILLFIDGFLAFFSNQIAKFFNLKIPCLFCTRLDHVLVPTNPDFYYNDSICDSHKKNISSLAYCHVHKKLSEIKRMCEGCLLSFATEKESDCDTYKSLIGILHKDLELLIDDEREFQLTFPIKKDETFDLKTLNSKFHLQQQQQQEYQRCSCCGDFLKLKSEKPKNHQNHPFFTAPSPSPRVSFNQRQLDLSQIKYTEFPEDEDSSKDDSIDERTPSFLRAGSNNTNRFFGIPLSDSAQNSPRWSVRSLKKSMIENSSSENEALDGDSILNHLKRQVRLDRKSLMDLYMELDEERSASAVAANNAMAMITRLQAEKAAVQMEALQYQRMMDEQAEYDQEALQSMNTLLVKREEDLKELEAEIEAYRLKFGCLTEFQEFLDQNDKDLPLSNSSNHDQTEEDCNGGLKENGSGKEDLVKELMEITERLKEIETKGELLRKISDVLEVSEGEAILLQISQNLHMLRSFVEMPSET